MSDRLACHVERFNAAVTSGSWAELVDTFTADAVMTFEGVPVGPFVGRAAIAEAYASQPPTDTMSIVSARTQGADDLVQFAWTAGGGGSMKISWNGDEISSLVVAFVGEPDHPRE